MASSNTNIKSNNVETMLMKRKEAKHISKMTESTLIHVEPKTTLLHTSSSTTKKRCCCDTDMSEKGSSCLIKLLY